jgi:predicted nuclease of predicted toxin-antitoxin system
MDEDSQDKILVRLLRRAGHDVITVNEVGLTGQQDPVVLDYARQTLRLLFTFNCDDFQVLHEANPNHPGILVVYHNDDFSKDMGFKAIIRAIANLEAANIPLINQFMTLNHWNY